MPPLWPDEAPGPQPAPDEVYAPTWAIVVRGRRAPAIRVQRIGPDVAGVRPARPPCAAALSVRAGWRTAGPPAPARRAPPVADRGGPAARRVPSAPNVNRGAGPRRSARPRWPGLAPDLRPWPRRRPG